MQVTITWWCSVAIFWVIGQTEWVCCTTIMIIFYVMSLTCCKSWKKGHCIEQSRDFPPVNLIITVLTNWTIPKIYVKETAQILQPSGAPNPKIVLKRSSWIPSLLFSFYILVCLKFVLGPWTMHFWSLTYVFYTGLLTRCLMINIGFVCKIVV